MDEAMKISLHVKHLSQFFWLRKIRAVNIHECCAKCFIGEKDNRMFYGTRGQQYPLFIEMDIEPAEKYLAYYLCGLSAGFNYQNNTHVAFLHAPGELLQKEDLQIKLKISNARQIDFESYVPNPSGEFRAEQRKCRNWIFANYIKDGRLDKTE